MNVNLLIDAIVRQTMVLIASLATSAGIRSPLAHIANQVFLDLVNELTSQGLGRKVIADMFGIALRTYHAKMQRLSESETLRGRSLWEAVYDYIEKQGTVSRARVLTRFRNDDGAVVRGVLHDLVQSGLITCTGRGDSTIYRRTSEEELDHVHQSDPHAATAALVWIVVYRNGPVDLDALVELTRLDSEQLEDAVVELIDEGRIRRVVGDDGHERFTCQECVIPIGAEAGWEAALFDHYQALVTAMCTKLRAGGSRSSWGDAIGGSTYTLEIWRGHPDEAEVLGLLREVRQRVGELRSRVDGRARPPSLGEDAIIRVTFYAGQTVTGDDETREP